MTLYYVMLAEGNVTFCYAILVETCHGVTFCYAILAETSHVTFHCVILAGTCHVTLCYVILGGTCLVNVRCVILAGTYHVTLCYVILGDHVACSHQKFGNNMSRDMLPPKHHDYQGTCPSKLSTSIAVIWPCAT